MSMNFNGPMNAETSERIEELFKPFAMDERTALIDNLVCDQKQMKEIANIAKQPVSVELHGDGDIKEMRDGTKYRVTPQGWVKI